MACDKVDELGNHIALLGCGGSEALIPVIARTCYPIDESGLLREMPVKEQHKQVTV
jgi:hypothetical protein